MNEIVIKKHNFELAKNRLKEFSEKKEAELKIDKVRTDGGFLGLGDHKVTGYELNNRMETIQKHLIDINTTNNKTIKEFREIYNALDALDKDYITSIVASVKAIEKTSNDVRIQQGVLNQHNKKQQLQQNKLDAHQGEIDKIVDNIKKTVSVLKAFKEKLDGLKHLTDIDKMWSDCKTIHNEVRVVSDSFSMSIKAANERSQENVKRVEALRTALTIAEKKIEDLSKQSNGLIEKLDSVIAFTIEVEQITHLKDVDEMWKSLSSIHSSIGNINVEFGSIKKMMSQNQEDINRFLTFMEKLLGVKYLMEVDEIWGKNEEHQLRINRLEQAGKIHANKLDELEHSDASILERIDSNVSDINHLKLYKEKLSGISHLEDVDIIWGNVEKYTLQLTEIQKRDERLAATIQKNKEEVDEKIAATVQKTNATVNTLTKKVKYAYLIAGGSAGLAIVELILLLTKVI
ncbi:hypothetical protein BFM98_14095 [Lysinibacillus sp. AR18-8]|uniref:hypothetical protein n=1 Tax=Lysinibacillus sp. AR18-8 TaxID=1889781 RepID=UPI000823FBFE|nr:hypothetical protein [Lysinibacillus sp. AR18-8]OCX63338.1 hypothetical protein BFM98_14095 [Lysinibacillus sp. AR18-8]